MKNSISLVIGGAAGQGLNLLENLLIRIFNASGYTVFTTKEYMSRVRGGSNSVQFMIGNPPVYAPSYAIDICVLLDQNAFAHLLPRLTSDTTVIGDESNDQATLKIPISQTAKEIGSALYENLVVVGYVCQCFKLDFQIVAKEIRARFASKKPEVITNNLTAAKKGYSIQTDIIKIDINKDQVKPNIVNGSQAVALGALAGGCDFISAYPMSPGTGVLAALAKQSLEKDIIVEQAEDEIASIHLAYGAWYAGKRAMITTAGGGFSLMSEAVSLIGITEMPMVLHVAQRPGPATGLPTKTEQADLNLVLYAGHGEFPRVIYAPGTLEEGFYLTQKAFNIADQLQVPVFILTDQYYVDTFYNCNAFDSDRQPNQSYIVKTDESYQRYQLTKDGISPRGIPGYGDGLVAVDSHEHTEDGHITEDPELRQKMMDKRFNKMTNYQDIAPTFIGPKKYSTLVICWGSTYHVVKEALQSTDVAILHFSQVFPVPQSAKKIIEKAKNVIVCENNATGQFTKLLVQELNITVHEMLLKYNGQPFFIEDFSEILKAYRPKEQ